MNNTGGDKGLSVRTGLKQQIFMLKQGSASYGQIKFDCTTVLPTCVCIAQARFHVTVTESKSCNRNRLALKA